MAIFLSDLMVNGGAQGRSPQAGQEVEITGTVLIPAGTDLATSDEIKFIRLPAGAYVTEAIVRSPDLDDGSALTLDFGYVRPTENPGKAYNATSNPYITGAISAADVDLILNDSTIGQAGGVSIVAVGSFTATQAVTGLSGVADFAATVVTGANTATTAGGQLKLTLKVLFNDEQTQTAISGNNSINYLTNINL